MPVTLQLDGTNVKDVSHAAKLLRAGGTVAFPTETVYGLGANALSPDAVTRIFAAKERPSWDPLIVHVPDCNDVIGLVQMDGELLRRVEALAAAFWPGPLTLLLPRRPHVPDAVTAGRPLVGVRIPGHATALALLRATGLPLAAPSANRFGHTSPTTAQHVMDDLDGRIDAVLDAGPASIGVESTVLDPTTSRMTLYRPGVLTAEQLQDIAGAPVDVFLPAYEKAEAGRLDAGEQAALPAPGVGLRHYAPNARLILVPGTEAALASAMMNCETSDKRVGALIPDGWIVKGSNDLLERWGPWNDPDRLAAALFSGLRNLDASGAEIIFCPLPEPGGLRDAIRDRLQKAARAA